MNGTFPGGEAFPPRLLDDYLLVAKRRARGALPATALRTRSLAARVLLARAATPKESLEDLVAAARHPDRARLRSAEISPAALADLARIIALQEILPDDHLDGLALYDLALELFGPDSRPEHQGLHAQLAFHVGDLTRAARLCDVYTRMPEETRLHLSVDLLNTFAANGLLDPHWLRSFRGLFPEPQPALAEDTGLAPFDRLTAAAAPKVDSDERISIIVTSYRPDVGLLTAVRSLVSQSWANIEIIIVDDASPSEHDVILKQCLDLDERVRLIKLSENGGTYVARNAGLEAASGRYVTFQDSDDWSHPRRLEAQIQPLLQDPSLLATTSDGLRATNDLIVSRLARQSRSLNTSSLMFRKDVVMQRIGYFDRVRKSADTEYLLRIQAAFGETAVKRIRNAIYAIIRDGQRSLSSTEFRAGWIHPSRDAYRSAYMLWHEGIKAGDSDGYVPRESVVRPFPAPAHLGIEKQDLAAPDRYDVIYVSDWRPYGGPQKSMIEEIVSLTRRGMRVAVMQMEAYRFMTKQRQPLCRPIQELINLGRVDHVLFSDDIEVSLLIIRYPPVLQFAARTSNRIRAHRVIILANQAPSELDGSDLRYVPQTCTDTVKELFGVEPQWCPQGPAVRAELVSHLDPSAITAFDMPGIIDGDTWIVERTGFRSDLPVIGRHSRDNWTKWPQDRATLLEAYPDSPDFDVRIMGGGKSPRALLGTDDFPMSWLVYDYDEVSVRSFLFQIDFYVYFPHPNMIEAFGRAILEALASGCVVVLPSHFEKTFGDAAIYCTPGEVQTRVRRYYANKELFLSQSRRAQQRVRERYSHNSYFEMVSKLINNIAGQTIPLRTPHTLRGDSVKTRLVGEERVPEC